MQFSIRYPGGIQRIPDEDGLRIILCVYGAESNDLIFSVNVDVTNENILALLPREPSSVQGDKRAPVEPILLWFGIRSIESGLLAGTLPPIDATRSTFVLDANEIETARGERQAKQCDFQLHRGGEILCVAGSRGAAHEPVSVTEAPVERAGHRHVLLASRPICNICHLPDSRIRCSHLHHVEVKTPRDSKVPGRHVTHAICDANQPEVTEPARCMFGGHSCCERIVAPSSTATSAVAPLALHEAIDFLAITWRAVFGKPLLRARSAVQVGSLALDVSTRPDLEARLSSLADLLKLFDIPDDVLAPADRALDKSHTFQRLLAALRERYRADNIDQVELSRVERAVDGLRAANQIRAAFQHTGVDVLRVRQSWSRLGLEYPPRSWPETWNKIRHSLIEHLRAIRDGLEILLA